MRPFLITVVLGMGLVSGFIYSTDLVHLWHREYPQSRNLNEGEVWVWAEANVSAGQERAAQIKVIDRPDVVCLGTSETSWVDSKMFNPRLRFYNGGIAGGMVEDLAGVWRVLKENDKTPRQMILFLSAMKLSGRESPSLNWFDASSFDAFRRTTMGFFDPPGDYPAYLQRVWTIQLNRAKASFSWGSFKACVGILKKRLSGEPLVPIVREDRVRGGDRGYRRDGSICWPGLPVYAPEVIRRIGQEDSREAPFYDRAEWAPNPKRWRMLRGMLADFKAQGIEVAVIIPPYQIDMLKSFEDDGYLDVLRAFHAQLLALQSQTRSFDLCDALDPVASGCAETDFTDGEHVSRSCAEKVLRRCLSPSERWRPVLSN